jgi:hypothetical protein
MELIYSRQASDFIKGRAYANPRFYSRPRSGVTKVFIVGEWPHIEADYKALGVEIVKLSDGTTVTAGATAAPPVESLARTVPLAERADVEIAEDWANLPWPQLRQLGQALCADRVLNKAQAAEAVEAELARRAAVRAKAEEVAAAEIVDEEPQEDEA